MFLLCFVLGVGMLLDCFVLGFVDFFFFLSLFAVLGGTKRFVCVCMCK